MIKLAGTAQVQVMNSTEEEPLFFGDMRQYTSHTCSFGDYLTGCDGLSRANTGGILSTPKTVGQAYLAQASLDQGQPLAALRQDFDIPEAIRHVEVNRTNLWMSIRGSRSSLHYDPYHNLLCLVQGEKTVRLMSPELTHLLYPMSILGESPNHSHVNFAHPDLKQHPLYKQALASQQVFTLQAGDALFIPEGWWHQVDSQPTTIAINFWWQSAFTKGLQHAHMQQYYLRRLLDGVLDTERCRALASVQPHPVVQALQAAVETIVSAHDQPCDTTSSDSSDPSSATTAETSDTSPSPAVATAAKAADQAAQLIATAAVTAAAGAVQPPSQDSDVQQGQDQASIQHGFSASAPDRQSEASLLAATGSGKPARKRKAADISHGCRPGQGNRVVLEHLQEQQPFQRDMMMSVSEEERLLAPDHSVRQATQGQSERADADPLRRGDLSAPSDSLSAAGLHCNHGQGMSAAQQPPPQHAEDSTAEADCTTGHQEPLHMACMQLLASAVAERLGRPDPQGDSPGLDDPITCILASLRPGNIRPVLAAMSQHVPRTLEALLLHVLPPAAAELLTQKLEQADAAAAESTGSSGCERFYAELYGVTNDPQNALHALLDKKEAFSLQLCQSLMSRLLHVQCRFAVASSH